MGERVTRPTRLITVEPSIDDLSRIPLSDLLDGWNHPGRALELGISEDDSTCDIEGDPVRHLIDLGVTGIFAVAQLPLDARVFARHEGFQCLTSIHICASAQK